MKQLRHVLVLSFLIYSLMTLSGCFQYPEGPVFTLQLKDERIDGTWLLTSFIDASGNDVTAEHENETLTAVVDRSGNRTWAEFVDGSLTNYGTFLFGDHSDYVIVTYIVLEHNQTPGIQFFYTVRKLTEKEFKYIDDQGNTLDYKKY